MRFWKTFLLIHVFVVLCVSAEVHSETLKNSDKERRLLQSELTLAQKTQIYFILNLEDRKVYVKARGIVLSAIGIKAVKYWGSHDKVKLYTLAGKAAFSEPRREEIIPENANKDKKDPQPSAAPATPATPATVDIKALELEDMPSSYRLKFDNGLVISVRPDSGGIINGLFSVARSINWYISQPMLTVWYAIKNGPYGALNLVLDETDARALYWSIHEGSRVLIYNPQDQ